MDAIVSPTKIVIQFTLRLKSGIKLETFMGPVDKEIEAIFAKHNLVPREWQHDVPVFESIKNDKTLFTFTFRKNK